MAPDESCRQDARAENLRNRRHVLRWVNWNERHELGGPKPICHTSDLDMVACGVGHRALTCDLAKTCRWSPEANSPIVRRMSTFPQIHARAKGENTAHKR